jgi:hypothetical protein
MQLNQVKCWQIDPMTCDLETITQLQHDIDLVTKSLLKQSYRAFFLNPREEIEKFNWYRALIRGETSKFYIDGSGVYQLVNIDLTQKEMYFEKSRQATGYKPWIFYSWQSDHNPSRSHIKAALDKAIDNINNSRKPRRELELVESTRPEDGAKDIVEAIKRNIDRSLIAVFDITNTAQIIGDPTLEAGMKYQPNANVSYELGYALHSKSPQQIILVKQRRKDLGNDLVPFDFQRHRYCQYDKPSKLEQDLMQAVSFMLEKMGWVL